MAQKYLVIGGCGLLGRYVAKTLVDRGDMVEVLDIVQRYDDIPFHHGDISQEGVVLSVLKKTGSDCVIHTASPLATEAENSFFWRVNVHGTNNVISACIEAGVHKLVYTSSSGVIFSGSPINGADETYPIPAKGFRAYHETKALAEKAVLDANGKNGLLTCALRPSGIFGPGDRAMMTAMYKTYQSGRTGMQIGDNTNLVDFTSVQNVAEAHVLAADRLSSPIRSDIPVAGEAFFITNDDPWFFWDFANAVWQRLGTYYPGKRVRKKPTIIPMWVGIMIGAIMEIFGYLTGKKPVMTRLVATMSATPRWHKITKAKEALGYVPKVSMS
ncbi:hypothetical protein K435DRAFT_787506, partial [Dendrothele bispora CBS 962.96]